MTKYKKIGKNMYNEVMYEDKKGIRYTDYELYVLKHKNRKRK